jgi:hypothetical protein
LSRLFYFIPMLNQALSLLASSSASSTYVQYASSPPSSRRDIIIDLEMELEILMGDLWIRNLLTD